MKSIQKIVTGIVVLIMLVSGRPFAQNIPGEVSDLQKQLIFERAIALLKENYIFPDRLQALESFIKSKFSRKGYAQLRSLSDFLEEINKDLETESKDHHLDIFFGPQRVRQIRKDQQNDINNQERTIEPDWLETLQYENFRFRKLERLDGNIGYFKFLNFPPLTPAKHTLVGAMSFVHQSAALIIDLRENGGGEAESMNFLLSYFLKDSLQTGEWRYRKANRIEKTFIPYDSAIFKIPDSTALYVLVSRNTSSAAEVFCYILQQFKRAIIVGDQTKGEGNPGQLFPINDSLYIMIPTIESRNIVSGKGIDGIGVKPDLKIDADKALDLALLDINKLLATRSKQPERKRLYQWNIPRLEAKINPLNLPPVLSETIPGSYDGNRNIVFENESFYFVNKSGKSKMEYLGENIFAVAGKEYRFKFPFSNEPVISYQAFWEDGGSEEINRIAK